MNKIIIELEENKILSVEELKEKLNIEDSKQFVELIKNIEKLTRKKQIVQLKNEKFILNNKETEFTGTIKVNSSGFAFVYVSDIESEIYIPKGYLKTALTGDTVRVAVKELEVQNKNIEGIVTEVVERKITRTVGTLIKAKLFSHIKSDDKNIDKYIKVSNDDTKNLEDGTKVLVEITEYAKGLFGEHKGKIIKTLGHKDDPGIDILSTIYKYDIPVEFSNEVEEELNQISEEVTIEEGYVDCTDELVVTIDGDDSKDLDDAVSLVKTKRGYRLKVFIADVSRYVKEDSYLDKEAINRGCSVYLVDRVVPMLPRKLSNNICSLNPDVNRYTICCEIHFDEQGFVDSYNIYPAVIKSKGRLTYKKVNMLYDNDKDIVKEYKPYATMLNKMLELSMKIRENREKRGAIDFDKLESKIVVDSNGNVQDVIVRERDRAEKLIEDFMLSANEVIAEHFYWLSLPFIYRIHEEPKKEKLRQFFDLSASFGYRVRGNALEIEPYMLANMLDKFKGTAVESMLSTVLLRTMNQARYSSINSGHFALSAKYYTHFTSPIRRYPDLLVHRMIRSYLFNNNISEENKEYFENILPDLAEKSSFAEKRAVDCEREVDQIKKCEYMLKHENEKFKGIISSTTRFGVFVVLPNMIEGLCHIKNMMDDYYEFDEKNLYLIGKRHKKIYRIGDEVEVKVYNVDLENQEIDFKILDHKGIIRDKPKGKNKLKKLKSVKRRKR
ncbi:ribonuclease R [Gemella palaticanis]|uniref:Ribonuclease R n=1 Tax=Gemelliphila palaticanis TaxID=81950 RepID=A0ABX2SYI7_9BACL|nr:ribonuclease R [Gemella palaticanis]NYS47390.1 ribonuclease R [Gemella palaticanis]